MSIKIILKARQIKLVKINQFQTLKKKVKLIEVNIVGFIQVFYYFIF